MIISILRLTVQPAMRAEVVATIRTTIGPTEAIPGCLFCRLCSDTDNDDELMLLTEWKSQPALDQYIRSDDFRRIIAMIDLAFEPPEISFNIVSSREGIELIERIRAQTAN